MAWSSIIIKDRERRKISRESRIVCEKGSAFHENIHGIPGLTTRGFTVGRHRIIRVKKKNKCRAFCFAAGGRFEVDERSGVVRTRGTDLFQLDMEYVLYVKAEDQNGRIDERRFQSTPEERLSIVGGKRAPQFYMTAYEAEIPENQKKDSE